MTDIVPTTRKRVRPGAPRWGSFAGPDLTVAKRESIWTATAKMPTRRRLERDLATDVCVVGAGIAGLSVAYTLAKAGRRVVVLDDGPLAGGMTAVTTAHITSAIDNRYFEVERLHGEANTKLVAQSMVAAIERIAQIVEEENIDCDFARLDGYLFVPPGEPADVLERELQACHRAGLADVELLLRAPIKSFDSGPALRFKNQAQFHPLKYLTALTRALERAGGQVFCKTHVDAVSGGIPAEIKAGRRTVRADAVVVATNSPINDMVAIHTKQAPYMTYVIGAMVPFGSVPRALYWDTADPYHYVRLQDYDDTHDVLIVGGEDHKTGQEDDPEERQIRLEQWARSRFPTMHEIKFRWGGQVMEPVDALAFIGHNPMDKENVYIATGDSGQGISNGTIAGMLIPDLILGRPNPWAEIYDPSRKTAKAIGEFARENLNVALQYTDHLTPGEVKTADEIPPDSGAVMRRGISKIAVYRDEAGTVHEFSATCPHLGCVVAWNDAEKSWDCPCHGSRFEKTGKLMNGPANTDLKPIPSGKGARSRQRT